MNQRQRIVVLALAGVLSLALVWALTTVGGQPDYGPLFTDLTAADAAHITEKLRDQGVPFRVEDNGKVILVPAKDVGQVRLAMAAEGLPKGGVVGFEIFDQTKLGSTDFERRVNYKRALEGELTRTLLQLDEIEDVRVMIVMPEPTVFLQDAKPGSASVWLRLRPFAQLDVNQVKGIVHLITHAVENVSPHDVSIIDVNGRQLTAGINWDEEEMDDLTAPAMTVAQMELQRTFQSNLERGLQNLLETVFGPGNVVARVAAELNWDRKVTESELFQPKPDGNGVIRSVYELERSVDGVEEPIGQVPGVEANVPGEPGGIPNYVADQRSTSRSEEMERVVNYEVNRIVDSITKAPGDVRRLTASVVINRDDLTPAQLESIRGLVAAAIGLDPERNDQVEVAAMPFDHTVADSMREAMEQEQLSRQALIRTIMIAVAAIVLLAGLAFAVWRWREKRKAAEPDVPELPPLPAPVAVFGGAGTDATTQFPTALPMTEVQPRFEPPEPTPEELEQRRLQEELERMAGEKPEDVAALLKGWLAKPR